MSNVMARPVGEGADPSHAVSIEAVVDGVEVSEDPRVILGPPAPANAKAPLLYFPDGRRYAVEDTMALDTVLAEARMRRKHDGLGVLIRRGWHSIVLLFLLLAAAATAAHQWTVPMVARALSSGLSSHMLRVASELALAELDGAWLAPSELDDARQNALRARFATLRVPGGEPIAWRVLFRAGERTGPVAFSLPDGDIVLTDQLVNQSRSDDEVVAVLAHEFSHLIYDDALMGLARKSPWLMLHGWIGSERNTARLAQGLLDSSPHSVEATDRLKFTEDLLAANGIDRSALGLLRAMSALPRPSAMPALLKGH